MGNSVYPDELNKLDLLLGKATSMKNKMMEEIIADRLYDINLKQIENGKSLGAIGTAVALVFVLSFWSCVIGGIVLFLVSR